MSRSQSYNSGNQSNTLSDNVRLIVRNRNIIQTSTPNHNLSSRNNNNNNNHTRNNNNNHEVNSASTVVTLRTDEGRDMQFRVILSALNSNDSRQQQQQQMQQRERRITLRSDDDDASRSSEETTAVALLGRIRVRRQVCPHIYKKTFCSKCHIRRRHMCRWWLRQQYRQL